MRQPDPLAGLVLLARPAEQVEDALVIARIDAASVVGDRQDDAVAPRLAGDGDDAGRPGWRYLVAFSIRFDRICSSATRSVTTGGIGRCTLKLMPRSSSRWRIEPATVSAIAPGSIVSGAMTRRPSRDSLRMALISRSIFCVEVRMKPIDSGRSSRTASRASSLTICGASASARSTSSVSGAVAAASSAVKPITLTNGERRSWLTI